MARENLPLNKCNVCSMGKKFFLFGSTPEPMVTVLGLKNHTSPEDADTLYEPAGYNFILVLVLFEQFFHKKFLIR